ncbi:MAG: hypothetical protein HYX84_08475 [Chloroflexi bacterium]|nr:hypothetical protein [Chloroflexota bacterium]
MKDKQVKRLANIQIVLGMFIILSFILFLLLLPGYYRLEMVDSEDNVIGFVLGLGLSKPNVLLNIWMFIYPALGLAVIVCGMAQLVQARRNSVNTGLPITQVALGSLIIVSLLVFITWAEPDWRPVPVNGELIGRPEVVMIRHVPDWVIRLTAWKAMSFIMGFGIVGFGTAQLSKTSGKTTAVNL